MIQKRFTNIEHDYENAWIKCNDDGDFMIYAIYKELDESLPSLEDLLNGLHEENIELHIQNDFLKDENQHMRDLVNENEQLKQDNASLMKLLENQSIIIQKLHSKILEFELKEPIVLTKADLELMDKAISYYTHGRYGE